MTCFHAIAGIAGASALCLAVPASAVPGKQIGTLPIGQYVCELPGDAGSLARIREPEADFRIIGASSYKVGEQRGIYLLTGDNAVMTSGPFEGKRFVQVSKGFLKAIDTSGQETAMRCVLGNRNNF